MNKTDLASSLAVKMNISNAQATACVSALFDGADGLIASALSSGDDVSIHGFGTFKVKTRAARVSRNPATGAPVDVPAKKVASFKPGKGLGSTVA